MNQSAVVFQHQVQAGCDRASLVTDSQMCPSSVEMVREEFLPNRDVVEEVFHFDARSECSIPGSNAGELIAVTGQLGTFTLTRCAIAG